MKLIENKLGIDINIISTPEMARSKVCDYLHCFVPFEEAKVILGLKDSDEDAYLDTQFTNDDFGCDYCGSSDVEHGRWSRTIVAAFCKVCKNTSYMASDITIAEEGRYPH